MTGHRPGALRDLLPGTVLTVALLAGLIVLPSDHRLPMEILLVFSMAQGWNLLCGYTGRLSFGHQAFIGLGAYSLFMTMNGLGVSLYLGLLASALASVAAATVIALLLQKLRDAYFAIGIWVVAEVIRLLFAQWDWVGSSRGMMLDTRNLTLTGFSDTVFWLAAGLALVVQAGLFTLLRSRFGLGLTATRDNDVAAASVGVNARTSRFVAFILSALVCGLAGGIYFLSVLYVDPTGAFDLDWQIRILFIVIVGGVGTLEGPIIGTIVYFALREMFRDYGEMFLIAQGAIALAVMLVAPRGIWGVVQDRTGWQLFPTRWRAG